MSIKSGTIAIVGKPNVGKSTLLNRLIGEKISIVSRKAQTTRHRIMGILTTDDAQYAFVDTPGFQTRHTNALNRAMNRRAPGVVGCRCGDFRHRRRAVRRTRSGRDGLAAGRSPQVLKR